MDTSKTSQTKKRILEAAINLFAEKGFSAATTIEIAERAKVAEVTIFRHFKTKKDLLHMAVLEFIQVFSENFAFDTLKKVIDENKDESPKALLKHILLDRSDFFQNYLPYIKVIFHEIQIHEDVRKLFFEKVVHKAIAIFHEIFEEIMKKEDFKNIPSMIAIRSLIGMTFMMFIQREFLDTYLLLPIEEEIDMIIDIFLNGMIHK